MELWHLLLIECILCILVWPVIGIVIYFSEEYKNARRHKKWRDGLKRMTPIYRPSLRDWDSM